MNKILIAYFSHRGENYVAGRLVELPVGNTERVAEMIARHTGGDLFRIERTTPYPATYKACVAEAVRELRELLNRTGSEALIEVDGGVNLETGARLVEAGADILVVGNAVFSATDPMKAIWALKNL